MSTEVLFISDFKMNPFDIFNDMTLLDFMAYIDGIGKNFQKRASKYSNSKHLATQLFALKQILNNMEL